MKITIQILLLLFLCNLVYASQKPVNVGTSENKVDLDVNFGNIQDNFDEVYGWGNHAQYEYITADDLSTMSSDVNTLLSMANKAAIQAWLGIAGTSGTLSVSPTSWDPPDGTTSNGDASQTFTLTATGDNVLSSFEALGGTHLIDAGTGTCSQTQTLSDSSCTIDVLFRYANGAVAGHTDTLSIVSDDATSPLDITVGPVTVTGTSDTAAVSACVKARTSGSARAVVVGIYGANGTLVDTSEEIDVTESEFNMVCGDFTTPQTLSTGDYTLAVLDREYNVVIATSDAGYTEHVLLTGATYPTMPGTLPAPSSTSLGNKAIQIYNSTGGVILGPTDVVGYTGEVTANTDVLVWTNSYTLVE